MDKVIHHGHGHAPWKWTYTMDMNMHHGNGHTPWTWTCSMDRTKDYYWTGVEGRNYVNRNYVYINIVITRNYEIS